MGASILDLTGQNPLTRLPSSEFHSLSGLREWLRIHCANEFGDMHNNVSAKLKLRHSASLHAPQVGIIPLHHQQQQQNDLQMSQNIDDITVSIRQCCVS